MFLGHAAVLAKALHRDITALGKRLEEAAGNEDATRDQRKAQIISVISDIKHLLTRIDGDIPLLQLAITASGESLSTSLPPSISPSRLLQASMLLIIGDTHFCSSSSSGKPVQIGPSFTLSLYMLFRGHSTTTPGSADKQPRQPYGIGDGERKPIWQEVLHKARVRVCRTLPGLQFERGRGYVPKESAVDSTKGKDTEKKIEYAYHLEIIEDLDDGRVHESSGDGDNDGNTAYDGVLRPGVQESIPMHQIAKLFYTDSGRMLNIGNANDYESSSVLLLKRDVLAGASGAPSHLVDDLESDLANEISNEISDSTSNGSGSVSETQEAVTRQLVEESKTTQLCGGPTAENDARS